MENGLKVNEDLPKTHQQKVTECAALGSQASSSGSSALQEVHHALMKTTNQLGKLEPSALESPAHLPLAQLTSNLREFSQAVVENFSSYDQVSSAVENEVSDNGSFLQNVVNIKLEVKDPDSTVYPQNDLQAVTKTAGTETSLDTLHNSVTRLNDDPLPNMKIEPREGEEVQPSATKHERTVSFTGQPSAGIDAMNETAQTKRSYLKPTGLYKNVHIKAEPLTEAYSASRLLSGGSSKEHRKNFARNSRARISPTHFPRGVTLAETHGLVPRLVIKKGQRIIPGVTVLPKFSDHQMKPSPMVSRLQIPAVSLVNRNCLHNLQGLHANLGEMEQQNIEKSFTSCGSNSNRNLPGLADKVEEIDEHEQSQLTPSSSDACAASLNNMSSENLPLKPCTIRLERMHPNWLTTGSLRLRFQRKRGRFSEKSEAIKSRTSDFDITALFSAPQLQLVPPLPNKRRSSGGERQWKCSECDHAYKTASALNQHKKVHIGIKEHVCQTCGASFMYKSTLTSHQRTHTGERRYKCTLCDAAFGWSSHLNVHMKVHTGEKVYKCDLCGIAFVQKGNLNTHMKRHAGIRPFPCEICGEAFSQVHYLKVHRRKHTGEKPYTCEICGVCFSHTTSLIVHIRMHTGEKPYKCQICPSTFSQSTHLRTHMKVHNKPKKIPKRPRKSRAKKIAVASETEQGQGEKVPGSEIQSSLSGTEILPADLPLDLTASSSVAVTELSQQASSRSKPTSKNKKAKSLFQETSVAMQTFVANEQRSSNAVMDESTRSALSQNINFNSHKIGIKRKFTLKIPSFPIPGMLSSDTPLDLTMSFLNKKHAESLSKQLETSATSQASFNIDRPYPDLIRDGISKSRPKKYRHHDARTKADNLKQWTSTSKHVAEPKLFTSLEKQKSQAIPSQLSKYPKKCTKACVKFLPQDQEVATSCTVGPSDSQKQCKGSGEEHLLHSMEGELNDKSSSRSASNAGKSKKGNLFKSVLKRPLLLVSR